MPIQVLPPQLANQIAAGEVVERPASVVKELVENSLDAGATRIDIEIERGGAKLIRIRDNGCGICKEELSLALARHATSKIASLDDLEAIASLGFRGEALASISSVSRLTLTSRTAAQSEAWQAYAEGRDMQVSIKPAGHPVGSTVEVLDLFYNTPARRKFLRTEKTEFGHIDEVIRRIALARFDIAFSLQHNGKLIRQYRPVKEEAHKLKRLEAICGSAFTQCAMKVFWQHDDLAIEGWIASPEGAKQLSDLQYSYVNGRMIKDRLINHAIRQAYQATLNNEQQPAYVLYIAVDPHQVDVNVHPAKHEVRFHQSRLVHDFIYQAVTTALRQEGVSETLWSESREERAPSIDENRPAAGRNSFISDERQTGLDTPSPLSNQNEPEQKRAKGHSYEMPSRPKSPVKNFARERQIYGQLIQTADEHDDYSLVSPGADNAAEIEAGVSQIAQAKAPLFPQRKQSVSNIPAFNPGQKARIGKALAVWRGSYAVVEYLDGLGLLSLTSVERQVKSAQLWPGDAGLKPQPLLIPLKLTLSDVEKQGYINHEALLSRLGISVSLNKNRAEIRAVPMPLRQQNLQTLLPAIFEYLGNHSELTLSQFIEWLAAHLGSECEVWSLSQAVNVLAELERLCPEALLEEAQRLIRPIDLTNALLALQHE